MRKKTKRQLAFVAGLVAWLVVVWLLWWSPVIYPVKLFVVLLHEVSHALMAVATGGELSLIHI